MRVISGTHKGLPLKAVPGKDTRPTTDKVKESIFNMIGPYFSGGLGLDLFAGSGGLGIEALSRGFSKVIFVDRQMKAVQTVKTNLEACRLTEQSEVYRNDADRALKALLKRELVFDGIFLDPPYKQRQLERLLAIIEEHDLLAKDGFIVCEHGSEHSLQEEIGRLRQVRVETYGVIRVSIYKWGK
ncbi:16S rRNA (guanine(966)-N(2))-methyltransferase RsmD [Bacillus thermotolerans]|uniref:Ribosomal RNA small subunit methyltransferase D n=1 Tax=Bacillus thermotolerans TaxID=1221996 RepID=A0A0F5I1U6_BACTR|nr:16S rRNA (guanine(966)-N(2))-methyltransferase RsmD [Bacillus thermotolerans]KKB39235.1 Ribosomal RNA small subunit methyltransferase D [Bacillus thermotolerans]KKB42251.1 Ribosomal RNA small subunit methyltransferase D [Bacillus thermotolerans]KKB43899.1 Ribosomal RNA small subunit methyltransferase D [Bacillus thermotolerans]